MTILITGASGFVGSAVLRRLIAAGHPERAFVRPHSDRRNFDGLVAEISEGDLRDPGSLRRALRGCTGVYRVARDYRLWLRNADEIYEPGFPRWLPPVADDGSTKGVPARMRP